MKTIFVKSNFILAIMFYLSSVASAHTVSGVLKLEDESPATGASVYITSAIDSTIVKASVVDENGKFTLEDIGAGEYLLHAALIGYTPFENKISVVGDIEVEKINLVPSANQLNEVTIKYKKPLIERDRDKIVVNVENSILAAGNSAWEVLGSSPGITATNSDQLSLKGRQGVNVWVNGKPLQLSGSDLANYLKSLPASALSKVEIISNPAARYDASGTSGIINLVMIKDKKIGTNGSISLSYGQGQLPKSVNSISLNHRNAKFNIYGMYNLTYRANFNKLLLYRKFYDKGVFTGAYDQDNDLTIARFNNMARIGVDFTLSDKMDLGILINGNLSKFNPNGLNKTTIVNAEGIPASKFTTQNDSHDLWHDMGGNIHYGYRITKDQNLTVDLDYAPFGNTTEQTFTTHSYDLTGIELGIPYILYGDLQGGLDIYSAKTDYSSQYKNGLKLEFGGKTSYVKADNDIKFFDKSTETAVFDSTKSNHFIYKENINALYANASGQFGKWVIQAGLRMENTNIDGEQKVNNTSFDKNYTNLFPSALAAYTFSDRNEWSFSVSRRIDRPSYGQLNPFKFFLDPTTYREGNPYLDPQTSWNYELTHTFLQKFSTTFGYSKTLDNITQVIGPVEGLERITVQTDKNLASFDYYGITLYMPFTFFKIWQSINSVNLYYGHYKGNLINTQLSNGNVAFNWNSKNIFQLKKDYSIELSGNYRSREIYGYMDVQPIASLSIGAQKQILNKKGTLKFAFTDIFYSELTTATTEFTDYIEKFKVGRDSRVATLSFTYRFGNNNVGQLGRRQGGAQDEKQRAAG